MHFIILLLLSSSLYLSAMDQRKSITDSDTDSDDDQGNYVINTMERYHQTLNLLLEKKGNDPNLWLESCKLAGNLETCIELGIIPDPSLKNTIQEILQKHRQTTQLHIERIESEKGLAEIAKKE